MNEDEWRLSVATDIVSKMSDEEVLATFGCCPAGPDVARAILTDQFQEDVSTSKVNKYNCKDGKCGVWIEEDLQWCHKPSSFEYRNFSWLLGKLYLCEQHAKDLQGKEAEASSWCSISGESDERRIR